MDVDLFIKKMPLVVKKLISREAFENRRSINQEAIALLEEALVHRVDSPAKKRKQVEAILENYANPRSPATAPALDPIAATESSVPTDLNTGPLGAPMTAT